MWKYRVIFSWSVIDREIRKIVQEGKADLFPLKRNDLAEWNPDLPLEKTSVWDFKKRGNWAVHTSDYRGNWPPQIPRNLILKHTCEKDLVFDPFIGGGTTLIEAYLLKRKSVGLDLNPQAIKFSREKIAEMRAFAQKNGYFLSADCEPIIIEGDANKSLMELSNYGIGEGSIDLICAHPPYLDSIVYSDKEQDLSNIKNVKEFCETIGRIAEDLYILLKDGGICGVLVGDVRRESKIVPLGFELMNHFLAKGFSLRESVIKIQHHDKSTEFYKYKELPQYLLKHEYLLIFEK